MEETVNLITGEAIFPFFGSPVISVSARASLFLPQRYERFTPFGSQFVTLGGVYELYEMPHGVMATRHSVTTEAEGKISVHSKNSRQTIRVIAQGAKRRVVQNGEGPEETKLSRVVVAWSQFFDDLIEKSKEINRENKLPWSEIEKIIFEIAEEAAEPRMALIVDIAERMHSRLSLVVNAPRKILFRERRMLPAGRVAETDTACLRWFVRQSGESIAEKAAANHQQLLGVTRRESFDTLENKVLKDFLFRCAYEGRRYLITEVGDDPNLQQSKRTRMMRGFCHLCSGLRQVPHLEDVSKPPTATRPNYVLQNDYRYKQVWYHYTRLLRREDEEDRLWDWQSRTWADVSRFLVNFALYNLSRKSNTELPLEELLASGIHLLREQHLGSRVSGGSEPGPFMVNRRGTDRSRASILEVVHPNLTGEHPATQLLGWIGGHLYLVLTPLGGGRRSIIVVWAVHTAGTEVHPTWEDISRSAGKALQNHIRNLDGFRYTDLPILKGFVLASDMESESAELHQGMDGGLHLVQVSTDQRDWKNALSGIEAVLEVIMGEIL